MYQRLSIHRASSSGIVAQPSDIGERKTPEEENREQRENN